MEEFALKLEDVNAGYGKLWVLYDVNVEIEARKITVIVGPNGSGKSTLLKTIFGLTTLYKGRIVLWGKDISKLPPHDRARMGIAYLPQVDNAFYNLTVRENLEMAAFTLSKEDAKKRIEDAIRRFPLLKGFMNRKASSLSGGERQMLAMAMALIRKPKVMLFDEPTAALAPRIASELLNEIKRLKEELGITVVLVEQNAKRALETGDNAVLMVGGKIVYHGKARDLLENPELGKMYLGLRR